MQKTQKLPDGFHYDGELLLRDGTRQEIINYLKRTGQGDLNTPDNQVFQIALDGVRAECEDVYSRHKEKIKQDWSNWITPDMTDDQIINIMAYEKLSYEANPDDSGYLAYT